MQMPIIHCPMAQSQPHMQLCKRPDMMSVQDAKEIVARLQPAARRTDLIRSPARRPLHPFQLRGPVATR